MITEFRMWTPFHYFMISFPFILALILNILVKNKSEKFKQNVGLILSIVMILILIIRNVYIWTSMGALNPEVFPFQVCHFASFVYLLAAISKNKVWGTMGWCLNFPAGLVSVIFADGLENYPTMLNTQAMAYIAGHMLIVTTGLYMLLVGTININWQSMKRMFLLVGCGYILSIPINNGFNRLFAHTEVASNYFYSFKPEAGTPLEDMFNLGGNYTVFGTTFNPVYLLMLALVGFIILIGMYGIYRLAKPANPKELSLNG